MSRVKSQESRSLAHIPSTSPSTKHRNQDSAGKGDSEGQGERERESSGLAQLNEEQTCKKSGNDGNIAPHWSLRINIAVAYTNSQKSVPWYMYVSSSSQVSSS